MARALELLGGHQVALLQGASELFPALVQAMDGARTSIDFETYICDFTDSGASVGEAMLRAAARGVRVRVLADGFGTARLPAPWPARLAAAGVQFQLFSPLGPLGMLLPYRWRRLHRKLCLVDGAVLFCGGINVLDDWYDPNHGRLTAPRFDFAVQVHGPIVAQARATMQTVWWRMLAARAARARHLEEARLALQASQTVQVVTDPATQGAAGGARAALLLRDNLRHRSGIERAYLRAIAQARDEIIIANAYFLPGRKLRYALKHAAARGVRVRLLLQGQYEYFLQYHGARPVYGNLLAAGIELYEYEPSFLHAKVAVIDADGARPWATVGSSNLDPLSLLLAREANVAITDADFARTLRARLVQAIESAGKPIEAAAYLARPWRERALDRVAYWLVRAALWLTGKAY